MTKLINKFLALLFFVAISFNSYALNVDGVFKQGGLVLVSYDYNKTDSIMINNQKQELSKDGSFYYPVKRSEEKLIVKQKLKDDSVVSKEYAVAKQDYKVQHIKGVKKEHVTPDPKHLARIGKESAEIKKSRTIDTNKYYSTELPEFVRPTNGEVTGVYGSSRTYNGIEKSWHKGLDLADKEGTLITAPLKGEVVLAMKDSYFNGNLLIISHGKKIYSIYAHLYDIIAKKGDIVELGDPIALVGSTGRSTGPHLHWGIYVGQQAIDPELLLKN